jgi:hypothetical protein
MKKKPEGLTPNEQAQLDAIRSYIAKMMLLANCFAAIAEKHPEARMRIWYGTRGDDDETN